MGYTIAADKIIFALSGGIGTLQDAINQAQTSRLPLFISPGNYATGDLVISAPVEIYATPGTVQLQPASTVNGFTLNIRSNTAGTFINDVTIQGVGFYGALLPFSAAVVYSQRWIMDHYTLAGNFNAIISAYQVTRLLIRDCNISYSGSNGIAMWQCTATINNNNFGGNVLCAIYSCDAWATTITDNYVHEGQNAGIGVCRQTPAFDGTIVRGNRVYQILAKSGAATGQVSGSGWFGNGIVVLNAYDIVIDGNVTNNCVFSGIRVDSSWNAQILGNQIIQSGETALFVEAPGGTPGETNPFGYHGGIVANNIVVTAGRGIAVGNTFRDGRRVVISGNSVSNITRNNIFSTDPSSNTYTNGSGLGYYTTTGVGIESEGDCIVSNNSVEGASAAPGIVLNPNPISGSTRKLTSIGIGNTVKGSLIGIGFNKEFSNCSTLILGNILEGYSNGSIVPMTLPGSAYDTWTRVAGGSDYGILNGGLFTGKPFANMMFGQNFAI